MCAARLYDEFADWWPLLSPPEDYAEEAAAYLHLLNEYGRPVRTLLELGSGGGNNASHLRAHAQLTLVEPAEGMLAVSRALNPDCEHIRGDMRDVRLGRTFDAVFIADAISYMTTPADLRAAIATAFVHCAPGGAALFAPDHLKDTFAPSTTCGGEDGDNRGLRYLEWNWDPDPDDTTYLTDFAFVLREGRDVRVEHDRHELGLFPIDEWMRLLAEAGFHPHQVAVGFVGVKPE